MIFDGGREDWEPPKDTRNPVIWVIAAAALAAMTVAAFAGETSSMIASTDVAEICATDGLPGSSYSRAHRVVHRKPVPGKILDHRTPLCLGGADTDANIQIQSYEDADAKDAVERFACREVCHGRLPLATAHGWFIGDNWRAVHVGAGR